MLLTDRVSSYDAAVGKLFAGPVGHLVDKILRAPKVEIPCSEVSVVSGVLCCAPYGRLPRRHETRACRERLVRELSLLEPRVVVALGEGSAALLDCRESDGTAGPCLCSLPGTDVAMFRTLHPRVGLWGDDEHIRRRKRRMYDDWQAISAHYRRCATP